MLDPKGDRREQGKGGRQDARAVHRSGVQLVVHVGNLDLKLW